MTLVHNEYDDLCGICNHPLGDEEIEAGVGYHQECYWRVMDEYNEDVKKTYTDTD